MACQKCGECCLYYSFFGHIDGDMGELLMQHYGLKCCDGIEIQVPHRCAQLDENNLCKIYENRPKKCREYRCKKSLE